MYKSQESSNYIFFIQFLDYFSSYETGQSVGGRKRENHLAYPQAELGFSHVANAGLEHTPDSAVR